MDPKRRACRALWWQPPAEESGSSESSSEESGSEELEVPPRPLAHPRPLLAVPNDPDSSSEEEGESSESEPESPEPVVQKKAAGAAGVSKTEQEAKVGEEKSVAGAEVAPPPKTMKSKVELEKPAPEAAAAGKEGEVHDDETEGDANVQGVRRGFDELQKLYSNLAVSVEEIAAHHPCGETLKRAFGSIADEKAKALESKIKKLRVEEMKLEVCHCDIKKEVINTLLSLMD